MCIVSADGARGVFGHPIPAAARDAFIIGNCGGIFANHLGKSCCVHNHFLGDYSPRFARFYRIDCEFPAYRRKIPFSEFRAYRRKIQKSRKSARLQVFGILAGKYHSIAVFSHIFDFNPRLWIGERNRNHVVGQARDRLGFRVFNFPRQTQNLKQHAGDLFETGHLAERLSTASY